MKKKFFAVMMLTTIALLSLVVVNPVLAKPGESQGKQKDQYNVDFSGDIEIVGDPDTAKVVNQWGMGIYGMYQITLDFTGSVDWVGSLNGQSIDFSGEHDRGELGLHTKDKGDTVLMGFSIKIDGYQHEFVLKVTGAVDEEGWMEDSFSISFENEPATILYKRSVVWGGYLTFTIELDKA